MTTICNNVCAEGNVDHSVVDVATDPPNITRQTSIALVYNSLSKMQPYLAKVQLY